MHKNINTNIINNIIAGPVCETGDVFFVDETGNFIYIDLMQPEV